MRLLRRSYISPLLAALGLVLFLVVSIEPVHAALIPKQIVPEACTGSAIAAKGKGCTLCHIGVMVINITDYAMYAVAIPAAGLLMAIGGITLLISGGSETLATRGKDTMRYAVIGLAIVLLAWLAVDTILKVLTGTSGRVGFRGVVEELGPWNEFPAERCGIN